MFSLQVKIERTVVLKLIIRTVVLKCQHGSKAKKRNSQKSSGHSHRPKAARRRPEESSCHPRRGRAPGYDPRPGRTFDWRACPAHRDEQERTLCALQIEGGTRAGDH